MAHEEAAKAATAAAPCKAHAASSAATVPSTMLPQKADTSVAAEAATGTSVAAPVAAGMPAAMACRCTNGSSATPCALHMDVLDGMRVDVAPDVSRAAASYFGDAAATPLGGAAVSRSGDAAAATLGSAAASVFCGAAASLFGDAAAPPLGGAAASHFGGAAASPVGGSAASRSGGTAATPLGGAAASHFGGAAASPFGGAAASRSGGATASPLGVVAATCISSEADVKSVYRRPVKVEVARLTAVCGEERRGEQEFDYGWYMNGDTGGTPEDFARRQHLSDMVKRRSRMFSSQ